MNTNRLVAAVLLVAASGMGLAAPAVAQTAEQIDQAFLTALRERGVPVRDDAKALDLAHQTCALLESGGTTDAALQMIQKAQKKWSQDDVVNFGGLAVYAYCQQYLPN